jgi:S1-C subfamily serine protease
MRGTTFLILGPFLLAPSLGAQEPGPPRPDSETEMIRLERVVPPGAGRPEGRIQILTTRRARLGIFFDMRAGENDSIGALVQGVTPNGPAARAGLRSGDIITRFNGTPLAGSNVRRGRDQSAPGVALTLLAAGLNPGDTVAIEYRRGADRRNVSIIAADEPFMAWNIPEGGFEFRVVDSADGLVHPPGGRRVFRIPRDSVALAGDSLRMMGHVRMRPLPMFLLGTPLEDLELAPLNPDLGRYFGAREGILVISVPEGGRLGLKAGDVVLDVDGRVPASPGHLLRILRSYESGEPFKLRIMRMKKRQTVTGSLEER